MGDLPQPSYPIFIGGAGRSGTTLVRAILDSHPRIACGPELKIGHYILRQWQGLKAIQAALYDAQTVTQQEADEIYRTLFLGLLEPYRAKCGKPRVAEKTPNNVLYFPWLHALFPQSPLIHVIRDGRDVVASLQGVSWVNVGTGEAVAYTKDVARAARYWKETVEIGRDAGHSIGERYLEVRYEALASAPEATLRELFAHIGEAWDARVLDFHRIIRSDEPNALEISRPISPASVGRWRRDLSPGELRTVMQIAGPALEELGYLQREELSQATG